MADVTLENVRKIYAGGVEAVHGVSLDIADGEFCVIVGPVRLRQVHAAAHDRRPRGDHRRARSRSAARVVNDVEPAERDIAMVFQNYALYPHMSVYDNMAYGLKQPRHAEGRDRARVDRRRRGILELEPFLDAQAARALRRPAPARRHGPRHRARAAGVPVRRAAVQPRRQAARADARRDPAAAARARRHLASTSPTTRSRR